MNKDRVLETLKKDVRSLLIPSKFGLSIQELERDYRLLIGSPLPLRTLDYSSTMELLLDMPDVVNIRSKVDGSVVLSAVVNEETKSVAALVSKQKTSSKRKTIYKRRITRPVCHMDLVRRGRFTPVLPASVKSELRDILSISPLLVSELESTFYKRFGRSFQYTRYGFYSLLDVLSSVSDFVQVQQTRAGSLLMLKTPVFVRTLNVTNKTLKCTNFQYSNPGNLFKGSNGSINVAQNAAKNSVVAASPLPSAVPLSTGLTALDKLFMAAKKEFLANNSSAAPCLREGKTHSEIVCSHVITENSVLVNSISSSLPSNIAPDIANRQVETLRLDTGAMKTDVTDGSLHGLQEKVICKRPEGLPVSHLLAAFKQYTGKDLPFREMGFMSVLDLVGSLGDMLYLEDPKGGQDWRLFDIDSKDKKSGHGGTDEKERAANDSPCTWSVSAQKSERMKLPVIISPADGTILWDPLDIPVSVSQHEIPPDAVRKEKLHSLPRMKRDFMIEVHVENVASPSNFYIRCSSKDTSQKLEDMMLEMRLCYSNEYVSTRYVVPDEHVDVGEIYALSVDDDVWWYRVIIHAIISSEEVQVFYPDFGTLATVKRCWLRFLKACYMKLPAQAVPCTLPYLKPVANQWSIEAIKSFQRQCARGPLVGVVVQYVLDQLCLLLCDTSTDKDIFLNEDLVDKGLASPTQEPVFYKMHNPFVHYLNQSSYVAQEVSQETSERSESRRADPLEIPQKEPVLQTTVREEDDPDLPYLEAFPIGEEDQWDEKWSFSGSTAFLNDALRPTPQIVGNQEEKPRLEEKIELKKINDEDPLSRKIEEFYISLIESKTTLEKSPNLQSPPRKCQEFEKTAQPAETFHDQNLPLKSEKEKLENNSLNNESLFINQTARSSNPLLGFQIPRRSATVALGPAARLAATPDSLLRWIT
ncbi:tudor domain-containing protein 5 isoform X2 [Dendrobates tinctorius]|uniref:tudor domain-containing protein 5 isoform X2 n=1 Tax=Dendrobates tinctorius TaxID=92724 RepID=UPI003CC9A94E